MTADEDLEGRIARLRGLLGTARDGDEAVSEEDPVVEVAREGTTQLDGHARAVAETVLQGFFASLADAGDASDEDDDAERGASG